MPDHPPHAPDKIRRDRPGMGKFHGPRLIWIPSSTILRPSGPYQPPPPTGSDKFSPRTHTPQEFACLGSERIGSQNIIAKRRAIGKLSAPRRARLGSAPIPAPKSDRRVPRV
jgi:hypothetical protein